MANKQAWHFQRQLVQLEIDMQISNAPINWWLVHRFLSLDIQKCTIQTTTGMNLCLILL